MAKKIEFGKFLIIEVSRNECFSMGGAAICDSCNSPSNNGYYIAVLNTWYCPKCYEEWKQRAKWYPQDASIERRNFETYSKILGIDLKQQ